jgi:hypothetical protein
MVFFNLQWIGGFTDVEKHLKEKEDAFVDLEAGFKNE